MTQEDTAEIAGFMHSLAILAQRPKLLRELVLQARCPEAEVRARCLPLPLVDALPRDDGDWEY